MGSSIRMVVSDPFVVILPGTTFIAQSETMFNAHNDVIYYTESIINSEPTKKELFLTKLKNSNQTTKIYWGTGENIKVGTQYSANWLDAKQNDNS